MSEVVRQERGDLQLARVQSLVDLSLIDIHEGTLILCGHALRSIDTAMDDEEIGRKAADITDTRGVNGRVPGRLRRAFTCHLHMITFIHSQRQR